MTSSNGSIFRFTGLVWGEFTGHPWIPIAKASNASWRVFMFSLICALTSGWANHRDARDLRRLRAHYNVNVMSVLDTLLIQNIYLSSDSDSTWDQQLNCMLNASPLVHQSLACWKYLNCIHHRSWKGPRAGSTKFVFFSKYILLQFHLQWSHQVTMSSHLKCQVMACHRYSTKPLSEVRIKSQTFHFNEMSTFLFRSQYVCILEIRYTVGLENECKIQKKVVFWYGSCNL